jgi:hypothetical protein
MNCDVKVYWKQIGEEVKLQILISEYVHLKKLDVIESWVKMHQVRELEEELVKRGVIWDRNRDLVGSEHLYVESAIVHVDTFFRANQAKLGALQLFSKSREHSATSRLPVAAVYLTGLDYLIAGKWECGDASSQGSTRQVRPR